MVKAIQKPLGLPPLNTDPECKSLRGRMVSKEGVPQPAKLPDVWTRALSYHRPRSLQSGTMVLGHLRCGSRSPGVVGLCPAELYGCGCLHFNFIEHAVSAELKPWDPSSREPRAQAENCLEGKTPKADAALGIQPLPGKGTVADRTPNMSRRQGFCQLGLEVRESSQRGVLSSLRSN